ncbi:hypothetical protein AX15_000303 [Amanita polypyramis BW_CC]|nr:hypothetical protein AX15_000303 [Amanita polypyramis BW_CC]
MMSQPLMALLAPFPSAHTRKSLSPFQAASLYETVAKALQVTLSSPPKKLDVLASSAFLASYAQDAAQQVLDALIWETEIRLSSNERQIRKLTLQLAQSLASSTSLTAKGQGVDLQILLGLSVAFAQTHMQRLRSIAQSVARTNPKIIQDVESDLVPSFTMLLSADQSSPSYGLYSVRKTAHSLLSFVRVSPPEIIRPFAYSKEFILTLADMYDSGLTTIATSYGGLTVLRTAIPTEADATPREPDDWERIWVSTKVALIDAFHTIIVCILDDLASSTGHQLGVLCERAFGVIFALLELRPTSSLQQIPSTPFLNHSLLADYQRTYNLSHTLATSLRHAAEKDARMDILESTLQALDTPSEGGGRTRSPGALKLLLRSSGLPQNDRYVATNSGGSMGRDRSDEGRAAGKGKATASGAIHDQYDPDLDIKVTQVLDVFPTHSPSYIRLLLEWPSYAGSTERVIEALLEGTAPEESELVLPEANVGKSVHASEEDDISRMVKERRNVFDDEVIDVSRLRIGKKTDAAQQLLGDRAYIDQMKADILRRVQEMELEDADNEEFEIHGFTPITSKGKEKAIEAVQNDEDDLDDLRGVKVVGDGESDHGSDEGSEEEEGEKPPSVDTILELAYIRDPKLFDRDAATRRSKGRVELKSQTGLGDEQIEGWKIMLERNPKKGNILEKHEFSGNRNWLPRQDPTPAAANGGSNRGGGRGRGGDRGRGRGAGRGARGGGHGPGTGDNTTKERAWKDKHKASHANHNRKRGHDRKMARGGGGPSAG